jgi:hypothetical protein
VLINFFILQFAMDDCDSYTSEQNRGRFSTTIDRDFTTEKSHKGAYLVLGSNANKPGVYQEWNNAVTVGLGGVWPKAGTLLKGYPTPVQRNMIRQMNGICCKKNARIYKDRLWDEYNAKGLQICHNIFNHLQHPITHLADMKRARKARRPARTRIEKLWEKFARKIILQRQRERDEAHRCLMTPFSSH